MPVASAPGDSTPIRLPDRVFPARYAVKKPAPTTAPFPAGGTWDEIRDWVKSHPSAALAWAAGAPPGPLHDSVAELICSLLAASDPAQAVAVAERLGGNGATNVMANVALQWAARDEPAASAWAAAQPPGEERDLLLSRIALVQSKSNPAEAAKLVAEQISPGPVQEEAAISVASQWAAQDPNAALEWAQSFPNYGLRHRAVLEVEHAAGMTTE